MKQLDPTEEIAHNLHASFIRCWRKKSINLSGRYDIPVYKSGSLRSSRPLRISEINVVKTVSSPENSYIILDENLQ